MKPSRRTLRRASLAAGTVLLLATVVVFEPARLADIGIASVGLVLVLYGLYDLRRVEEAASKMAEREREALEGSHGYVSETESLPRRDPFDADD